ncbi:MAG: Omp28-related outer membrane protein [Luteibaculaceae bacterium]
MNKIKYIQFISPNSGIAVFCFLLLFVTLACDRVSDPNIRPRNILTTDLYPGENEYEIPEFGPFPNNFLKVLVEDFTGHRCGFCPGAGVAKKNLYLNNPDIIVPVAIHAGPVGSSFQVPNNDYPRDFRTEAGNIYVQMLNIFANPMGTFNRISYPVTGPTQIGQFLPFWPAALQEARNRPLRGNIQVLTNYYPQTRGLFVHIQSQFFEQMPGEFAMVAYLLESNIVSPQLIYANQHPDFPQGGRIENFVHDFVLVDNINGVFGEILFTNGTNTNQVFEHHYTYEVPETMNDLNLTVVAYIYNRETYEVYQTFDARVTYSDVQE